MELVKKQLKSLIAIVIIGGTFTAFAWYAKQHPEVVHKLGELSPVTLISLLVAFAVAFVGLAGVLAVSFRCSV